MKLKLSIYRSDVRYSTIMWIQEVTTTQPEVDDYFIRLDALQMAVELYKEKQMIDVPELIKSAATFEKYLRGPDSDDPPPPPPPGDNPGKITW